MNNNGKSDTRGSFLENSLIQRYLVQCTVQTFRNLYKLSPIKINHLSKVSALTAKRKACGVHYWSMANKKDDYVLWY